MYITQRTDGDLIRLKQLAKSERNAKQRDRLRAVRLALEGRSTAQIQELLERSRRFVQRWVYVYRDHGIEAIMPGKPPGVAPHLPHNRKDDLRARIDAGPTEDDNVCALRGRDIQEILEKEFGVKYSLSGVYELLHRLGYSCLSPRPKHRKADPEAQEAFKKSAPFLLTMCSNNIPTRPSKSGSRTNCGPGNREH